MTQNKTIDILFLSVIFVSMFFIFDQAFADQQVLSQSSNPQVLSQSSNPQVLSQSSNPQVSSQSSNPQILFQSSNQTTIVYDTVTVSTDRSSYNDGEFVAISGYVMPVTDYKFVTIEIFNPNGMLVHIDQPPIGAGGLYHTSFIAGGVKWTEIGAYTVKVHYGSNNTLGTTIFTFNGKSTKQSMPDELTLNDNKLMRTTGITALYKTIDSLDQNTDFLSGHAGSKNVMLNETQNVNQTVLHGEYYGTYVGLSNIAQQANQSLTTEGKEKILPLVNDLIISVKIYTTPEFPAFVPLVLGILIVIGLLHFKNRLNSY